VAQAVHQGVPQGHVTHGHHDQTDGVFARVPLLGSVIHSLDLQTADRVGDRPL